MSAAPVPCPADVDDATLDHLAHVTQARRCDHELAEAYAEFHTRWQPADFLPGRIEPSDQRGGQLALGFYGCVVLEQLSRHGVLTWDCAHTWPAPDATVTVHGTDGAFETTPLLFALAVSPPSLSAPERQAAVDFVSYLESATRDGSCVPAPAEWPDWAVKVLSTPGFAAESCQAWVAQLVAAAHGEAVVEAVTRLGGTSDAVLGLYCQVVSGMVVAERLRREGRVGCDATTFWPRPFERFTVWVSDGSQVPTCPVDASSVLAALVSAPTPAGG